MLCNAVVGHDIYPHFNSDMFSPRTDWRTAVFSALFFVVPRGADPRAGEIVCRTCAVVLGERCIDDGAEWRTFTTDDVSNKPDPSRCGEPK